MRYLLLSKNFKILVERGKGRISTHLGIINLKNLKEGKKIKSHLGKEFFVVKPNILDLIERLKRGAQVILPKDIALIISYTGLMPNWKVLDIGTGSAFSSIFLANYLIKGKIVTYEKDERFYKIAKENIKFSGLKNIKIVKRDFMKGIKEKNFDLILLDLEEVNKAIKIAYKSIKVGGYLVIYSPTIDHLLKSCREMKKFSFAGIKIVENIVREWQFEKTLRPKTKGIMHTGFITIARKI
jgi:tRNA (adenine57-N1/adenine58-N1)-methyltransferase catalytic subunit